jgi:antitoxin HicB
MFRKDEDGREVVSFPDFPEARTDGKDHLEASEEAMDCLGSAIAFRMADKVDIPTPSQPKRSHRLVPVPLWIAGKLALYTAMKEKRVNNSDLARLLGVRETVVRRMLDPNHDTRAEKLHAALSVLGKRLTVAVEDAA